jgi:hypothetical protein
MCGVCSAVYTATGLGLFLSSGTGSVALTSSTNKTEESTIAQLQEMQVLSDLPAKIAVPEIVEPAWLQEMKAEEVQASRASNQTVTYSVASRGVTTADMSEFSAQVNETLNDSRGWSRLGVSFQEVESNGNFILVLSSADQMTSFSSGCSALWSCRVGMHVIINQDRWLGATDAWNQGGGSLRDYRHSVVNHEVGHWLGHGHSTCGGPGQPAKVMQQQSIDLQGCTINPWPLASELWSTQLGIDLR